MLAGFKRHFLQFRKMYGRRNAYDGQNVVKNSVRSLKISEIFVKRYSCSLSTLLSKFKFSSVPFMHLLQKSNRTSITRTRITRLTRTKFPNCLDQNFTVEEPRKLKLWRETKNSLSQRSDNSNSPLAQTVFRFPPEFEFPGFFYSERC